MPIGEEREASPAGPSSPEKPFSPLPARVSIAPSSEVDHPNHVVSRVDDVEIAFAVEGDALRINQPGSAVSHHRGDDSSPRTPPCGCGSGHCR